jgi:hypothetical protein
MRGVDERLISPSSIQYLCSDAGTSTSALGYDHEPVLAEATRRKVYDMLAAEKMMVQGFHYPFPSVAHVEKTATGYQEIPIIWNPSL